MSRAMRSAVIFLAILASSDAARILGLFPYIGKSHHMVFEPLMKTLAERGHNVTVASFFPLDNPPVNYTNINFQGIAKIGLESLDINFFENPSLMFKVPVIGRLLGHWNDFKIIGGIGVNVCEKVVKLPALQNALKKEYDLVIMETFNSDCMFGLLEAYGVKAPTVGLSSCQLMPWVPPRFGLSDNPSYVPSMSLPHSSKMTFGQRLKNTFANIFLKYWYKIAVQAKEQAILENHFGRKITDLEELSKNMSIIIVNSWSTLNGVYPLLPAIVHAGGMHLNPVKKPIPQVSSYHRILI